MHAHTRAHTRASLLSASAYQHKSGQLAQPARVTRARRPCARIGRGHQRGHQRLPLGRVLCAPPTAAAVQCLGGVYIRAALGGLALVLLPLFAQFLLQLLCLILVLVFIVVLLNPVTPLRVRASLVRACRSALPRGRCSAGATGP
jgi:hypothetical protein